MLVTNDTAVRCAASEGMRQSVPDALRTVIFRLLQEPMNNVAKHSKATRVGLTLTKTDGPIVLKIEDNRRGFDVEKILSSKNAARGMELSSMREGAELSGGTFSIESKKRDGTVIRAAWVIAGQKLPDDQPLFHGKGC
jgi:signal transduction histidine kinase